MQIKKHIFTILFTVQSFSSPLFSQQINVAILQFDAANISEGEVSILTDRLRTELINLGTFNVIERSAMEEVLDEQGFQQSGCVTDECAVEVGRLVGVDQMITGQIGKIGSMYTISARIIDIQTGRVISQKSLDCACPIETLLTESMLMVAKSLAGDSVPVKSILPPTPKTGSVLITSNIEGAVLFVGNKSIGVLPQTLEDQNPGQYSYKVTKDNYWDKTGEYKVEAGLKTEVNVPLFVKTGSVEFLSNIEDVELFVEDSLIGTLPLNLPEQPFGKYSYKAIKEGYRVKLGEFTVEERNPAPITVELFLIGGTLNVIPVRNKQLFDIKVGQLFFPEVDRKTINLPEGIHDVSIIEHGYHTLNEVVTIEDLKTVILKAENDPIMVPVNFQLSPSKATLTLNKKPIILVADQPFSIQYGDYIVRAKARGYEGISKSFKINSNDSLKIDLHLKAKSKTKSRALSTFLPGSGQLYADKTKKGLLFMALSLGSAYMVNDVYTTYTDEKTLMDQYYSDYRTATAASQLNSTKTIYLDQVNKVQNLQTELTTYVIVFGVTWTVNMIDALLFHGLPDK